jgi:D-lactate dehydrogenase
MAGVTAATRGGLRVAHSVSRVIGEVPLEKLTTGLNRLSGGRVPAWHRWMPRGAQTRSGRLAPSGINGHISKKCVYFSACVSRSMGTGSSDSESRDLVEVMHSLLRKAGYEVVIPPRVDAQCCGMPFSSKGFEDSAAVALGRLQDSLWQASEEGRLPVLCDTSPCTARMQLEFDKPLAVYEPIGFIRRFLLPELARVAQAGTVALHLTCSARKMGLAEDLTALAEACAEQVFVPEEEGCCGFAGDKGFDMPELNASALSRLQQQLPEGCDQGYSNSRTCEIGLSRHTGIPYRSIAYLVDRCYAAPAGVRGENTSAPLQEGPRNTGA